MNNYLFLFTRKKVFLFGILSFVVVAVISVLFFANGKVSAAASSQTVKVTLVAPVSIDAFLVVMAKNPLDGIILESSFMFNKEAIQDFYVVNTKDRSKNVKEDYIQNRKALIADLKGIKELSSDDAKSIETILIKEATIMGQKSSIDGIRNQIKVSKVDIAGEQMVSASQIDGNKARPREAKLLGDRAITTAAQTQPMYLSLPTSGTAYFYPSAYGGRYTQQNMRWTANYFAPEETYEHKVYLYNYDRKTYLDGTSTAYPGCYPMTTYAATTWPAASYPYLDTRLSENLISCEIDELSYTIGAAQANAIPANVDHYTYIRTSNGNDTSDKFKLQGQVGYRNPITCYTTWCSSKYKIYSIIPSWSTIIPGTQSWTYSGQAPEAPSNVSVTNPTATSLRVNFTDNTYDETNILIERKTGVSGSWVLLGGFGILNKIGNWYWNNTGLASQTTYCYRLKAINAVGSSLYSNEACGTTL